MYKNILIILSLSVVLFACGGEEIPKGTISGTISTPTKDKEVSSKKIYLIQSGVDDALAQVRQELKDKKSKASEKGSEFKTQLLDEDKKLESERKATYNSFDKAKQDHEARTKFDKVLFKKFETTVEEGYDFKQFESYLETYSQSVGLSEQAKKEAKQYFVGKLGGFIQKMQSIDSKRKKIDDQLKDGSSTGGINIQKTLDEYNSKLRNIVLAHAVRETSIVSKEGQKYVFEFVANPKNPLPNGKYYLYVSHLDYLWFFGFDFKDESKEIHLNGSNLAQNFLFERD